MWRYLIPVAACGLLAACNPYYRFIGQTSAGAVDPVDFPQAYLGISTTTGGPNPGNMPGSGQLLANVAFVNDIETDYYIFPYTGDSLLSLAQGGALEVPVAYDFDDAGVTAKCVPPKNYVYDQQRDDVDYSQQGNIFTLLPDAAQDPARVQIDNGYQPVVADVKVTPNGLPCQATKEEANLVTRKDVTLDLVPPMNANVPNAHPTGKPSGTFYARAIIDPSIDVRGPAGYYGPSDPGGSVDPNTGLGPQVWAWYQRYLLAYLEGGAVPTTNQQVPTATGMMVNVTAMTSQNLYFPTSHPGMDPSGNLIVVQAQGPGEGYDVLSFSRTYDPTNYSPICEVFAFDPADPMNVETDVGAINMSTAFDTGEQVWCLQLINPAWGK